MSWKGITRMIEGEGNFPKFSFSHVSFFVQTMPFAFFSITHAFTAKFAEKIGILEGLFQNFTIFFS